MPALDAYDGEDLDDGAEADVPMSFEARARAEAAMARRDQREGRTGGVGGRRARLPGVLQGEHYGIGEQVQRGREERREREREKREGQFGLDGFVVICRR